MPYLYQNIEGWFSYSSLYEEVVRLFGHNTDMVNFCEIGCWFGRSGVFLLEEIKEKQANIVMHFVDHWKGGYQAPTELKMVEEFGGGDKLYTRFCDNTALVPEVKKIINRKDSLLAVKDYPEEYFSFIFIDAAHEDFDCYNDMVAWLPKLKVGGIMAGHDIDGQWVRASVDRFSREFGTSVDIMGGIQCWRFTKNV